MEKILSKFPGDATSWGLEKEYAFPELFEEGLPTDMSTFQQMCCALSPCEPEHHHLSPVSEHLDLSHHPESVKFQYWVACCRMNGRPFPAAELLRCPLIWCRNYFNNRDELTQHVKDCSYLDDGEYWCPKCEKRERFAFHPTYEEWKPHRAQIPFGLCIFRKALRTFRAWAKGSAKFIELDALMPASENELELLIDRPYRLPQIASSREFSVLSGIPVSELTGNPIIFPELSVERMSTSGIDLSTPGAYELENLPIKDNQFYYSESDTDGVQSPQRFSSNYFTARGESPSLDLGESHFALEHHQHVGNLPQDFTKVEAKANSQDRHQWSEAEIRAALNQSAGFHQGPLSLQTFDTLQRNVFLQVLKQLSHILHHDTMRKLRSLPNSSYASSLLRAGAWSSADSLLDGGFTVIKAILRNEFPTTLSEVMMFSFLVFTIAVVSDQESLFSGDLYDNLSSWRLVITSDMDKANFLRAIRDLWPPQDKATYHRPSIFTPMSVENEFVNTTYAPAYCASTNFSPLFVIPEVPLGQVAENTGQTSSSLSTGDPGDFHTSLKQGLAMRTVCSFMETLMFYDLEKKIAFHPKNQAENSVGGCDFTRLIIRFVTSPLLALDGLEAFQPVVRKAEEKLQSGVLDNIHDVRIYLLQDAFNYSKSDDMYREFAHTVSMRCSILSPYSAVTRDRHRLHVLDRIISSDGYSLKNLPIKSKRPGLRIETGASKSLPPLPSISSPSQITGPHNQIHESSRDSNRLGKTSNKLPTYYQELAQADRVITSNHSGSATSAQSSCSSSSQKSFLNGNSPRGSMISSSSPLSKQSLSSPDTSAGSLVCKSCGKTLKGLTKYLASNLQRHLRESCPGIAKKRRFPCLVRACAGNFSRPSNRAIHMKCKHWKSASPESFSSSVSGRSELSA